MTKRQLLWLFIWIFIFFLIFCLWNKLRLESATPKIETPKVAHTSTAKITKKMYFKARKDEDNVHLTGRVKSEEVKTALVDAYGKVFQSVHADDLRIDAQVKENNISNFFINFADNFSHFSSGYASYHDANLEIEGVAEEEIIKLKLQEQLENLQGLTVENKLFINPLEHEKDDNNSTQSLPILHAEEDNTTEPSLEDVSDITSPLEEESTKENIQEALDAILKNKRVQFLFAKNILTKNSKAIVEDIVALMQKHPTMRIEIAGHTDSYGKRKDNLFLSQERSQSIKEYMISRGIKEAQLKATGFGESMPLYKNNTRKNRRRNRRVEFKVIGE